MNVTDNNYAVFKFKNKEVKAAVDELTTVLGSEDAAYYIISEIMVMQLTRLLMELSLLYFSDI